MILTDEMLASAFQCRKLVLWGWLADCDVFAFRLSDGETGYCCLMGHGGEHYAVGFYRGQKGFTTYLKTVKIGETLSSACDMFELSTSFDCINCDFVSASMLKEDVKKRIREYARVHGLKIQRPNGWPDFVRHRQGHMPGGITSEADARDIVEALNAVCVMAEMLHESDPVKLGFDEAGDYPTLEGGKVVPFLVPNGDGTYDCQRTSLPAFVPDPYPDTEFANDLLLARMKKIPSDGTTLQVKSLYLPMPAEESETSLPLVLMCLWDDNGLLFPVMDAFSADPKQLLASFVDCLEQQSRKPATVEVVDDRTQALLKQFCLRCGIRLVREEELPELEEACTFALSSMMM